MKNPLLEQYRRLCTPPRTEWPQVEYFDTLEGGVAMEVCRRVYSYAVPDDRALDEIAKHGPIVEIGAGLGYWAGLLRARGVDVVAYDDYSWDLIGPRCIDVRRGNPTAVIQHADRALFLCWPPYDTPMAHDALSLYKGSTVIYIGEGSEGCTADDSFHRALDDGWRRLGGVAIPQLPYVHDHLEIYQREDV